MILFSGSSNLPLAQNVAKLLKTTLGAVDLQKFADGEIRPWIQKDVRDKTVFVLQSFSHPMNDHIMEFILMGDAIRRGAPKRMVGIIPYFGYSRQDKQHRSGEPVSARVIAKLVEVVPYHEVITIDLHNDAIVGFFRIPVIHCSALPAITERVKKKIDTDSVVVAPDVGGVKRARNIASLLDLPLVVMEKKRNFDTHDESENYQIIGEVQGKTALIIDDIISTGGTIANAAAALKEAGSQKIIVCATHAVFSGDAGRVLTNSPIDSLITTDTIVQKTPLSRALEIATVAPVISNAIRVIMGTNEHSPQTNPAGY